MRTNKTKDRIRDGLFAAMKTKAYADITITDVIKASGIARASFYRSYKNLDDVLQDIVAKYRAGLERLFFPELLFAGKELAINRIADFFQRIKNTTHFNRIISVFCSVNGCQIIISLR